MSTRGGGQRGDTAHVAESTRRRYAAAATAASVTRSPGGDAAVRHVFGKRLSDVQLTRLLGADASATVHVLGDGEHVIYNTNALRYYQNGEVARGADGRPYVYIANEKVEPEEQRQGRGTRVFARQVKQAARLGVSFFELQAARVDYAGTFGYRAWPRLGFDATLPEETRAQLPPSLASARTVLGLMRMASGRAWWDEHGTLIRLRFDMTKNSLSRRVLTKRLKAKGIAWADL